MGVLWLDPNDIETLIKSMAGGASWATAKALLPSGKVDGTHLDTWQTDITARAAARAAEFCPGPEARALTYGAMVTPTISAVSPGTADPGGGEIITVTGTGFQPGATVTLDVHACTVLSVNPTTIKFLSPAHAAENDLHMVITNPDTTSVEEQDAIDYTAVDDPTFTSITPSAGTVKGGDVVRIVGTKFRAGVTVKFGTEQAYVQARTGSTVLFAVTPPHAAGAVALVITNPNAEFVSAAAAFTYA
jgi:hypothetical protein